MIHTQIDQIVGVLHRCPQSGPFLVRELRPTLWCWFGFMFLSLGFFRCFLKVGWYAFPDNDFCFRKHFSISCKGKEKGPTGTQFLCTPIRLAAEPEKSSPRDDFCTGSHVPLSGQAFIPTLRPHAGPLPHCTAAWNLVFCWTCNR